MLDLTGSVAVVTGSSRGIGRAIAEALVRHGCSVVVSSRSAGSVDRAAAGLSAVAGSGASVVGIPADMRKPEECRKLIDEAVNRLGRLDILINNAGIGIFKPVAEMSGEEWESVLRTNLDGVFHCTSAALPHLKKAGRSWIINIASLAGKNPFAGGAAYNASKFGLVGFSEALMLEVRQDGVRVSYIMPGSVATEFSHPLSGGGEEWKIQPEDIAELVVDLLSMPDRTLPSRIEVRPSKPPKK